MVNQFKQLLKKITIVFLLVTLSYALAAAKTTNIPPQTNATTNNKPVLAIQQWQTSKGANVLFVPLDELPIIDINITFNAGSARDGQLYGLASLTNSMIGEGTQTMTTDQIIEAFDNVGAQFGTNSARDAASIQLRSLTYDKQFQPSLDTFVKVINDITFPEDSFKRVKNQTLQVIQKRDQKPDSIASRKFYETLYGEYPYGHDPIGNSDTVNKITIDDIKNFYSQYYVAKNATIAIVGNVSREQAETIANKLLEKLPQGQAAKALPDIKVNTVNSLIHVDFPSTQTSIRIGELGIKRDDPDYVPLYVGNYILGGGILVSRLFTEIREKRGLTYGVDSVFIPMKNAGPFMVGMQTRNQVTDEAINITNDVIKNFLEHGPTSNEVIAAKNNIIGGFPLWIDSNSAIADNLIVIGFYQLPLNYLDTFRDQVNAVTVNDINTAFKKHVDMNQLITVTVGPANAKNG